MYGNRTAAIRTKWIILVLFGLGALSIWSGSEAVLPAYIVGMVLAEFSNDDTFWIRRLRTLTVGFLDALLFPAGGNLRFFARSGFGTVCISYFTGRESPIENIRTISGYRKVPPQSGRALVLYVVDVHRVDLRNDLSPVWVFPPHRNPGAILFPGGRGHCQCRSTNTDRRNRFPAPSSSAGITTESQTDAAGRRIG